MLKRLSSPLNTLTIFIGTLFLVNLLIFITNLPLLFSLLFIPKVGENIIPVVLSGALLGPAIAGGISVIWRYMNTGEYNVWQRFWQGYKRNFWQSLLISGAICLFAAILIYNLRMILAFQSMVGLFYPTLIFLMLLPTFFFQAILLSSRFEMTNRHILLNTLFFMLQNRKSTLKNFLTIILFFACAYLTGWKILFLLLFSLPIYLVLINVQRTLKTLEKQQGFEF